MGLITLRLDAAALPVKEPLAIAACVMHGSWPLAAAAFSVPPGLNDPLFKFSPTMAAVIAVSMGSLMSIEAPRGKCVTFVGVQGRGVEARH